MATAFENQLDSLYSAEAMDISTDIQVLDTILKSPEPCRLSHPRRRRHKTQNVSIAKKHKPEQTQRRMRQKQPRNSQRKDGIFP